MKLAYKFDLFLFCALIVNGVLLLNCVIVILWQRRRFNSMRKEFDQEISINFQATRSCQAEGCWECTKTYNRLRSKK